MCPEQVFRGYMVSTLKCQECFNLSSRHEYFLDMSLPVSVEKAPPPQRRRSSPDNEQPCSSANNFDNSSFFLNPSSSSGPTKSQLKKEKEEKRKAKRAPKHHYKKLAQIQMLDNMLTGNKSEDVKSDGKSEVSESAAADPNSDASSCSSESDADVEDNLQDDTSATAASNKITRSPPATYDTNGNKSNDNNTSSLLPSPLDGKSEKRDDSPENMDKDSLDEDENGKFIL